MRIALALGALSVVSLPLYAQAIPDWILPQDLQDVVDGQDLDSVADRIASREFTANVTLDVVGREQTERVRGAMNETFRADRGSTYWRLMTVVENHGRVPVGVHTYHFSVEDDAGMDHRAEIGLADGFFVMRLAKGQVAEGVIVVELPDGIAPYRLTWLGEMGEAETLVPIV